MGTNHRSGKVALVTGGSRGLGVGIAQALADEGADAAITCLVSAEKAEAVARGLEAKDVECAAAFWSAPAPWRFSDAFGGGFDYVRTPFKAPEGWRTPKIEI